MKATNKQLLFALDDIDLAEFMYRATKFYFDDVESLTDWLGSTPKDDDDNLPGAKLIEDKGEK